MGFVIPAAILAARAGQAYFNHKSKSKKAADQKKAATAQLTIGQKQREDARRARLKLGGSMLNGVPSTTAGGSVNTNVGLDPELLAQLGIERTYDFGSTVPNENAGAGSAFASGLFGAAGDTLTRMYSRGAADAQDGGGSPTPSSMLYDRGQGAQLPGGMGPQNAPLTMGGGNGGTELTMEELMKLIHGGDTGGGGDRGDF